MSYVFEPDRLQSIVHEVLEPRPASREAVFDRVVSALDAAHPGAIETGPRQWLFNNAGGAMGQMCFLHVSLREYLILFGTPIGTEGHSGRYSAEVFDILLDGEMWGYVEGQTDRTVIRPGDMHHLDRGVAKGYRIPDHAWMLEYGRGSIASMVPFGVADSAFSTLDFSVLGRTLRYVGSSMVRRAFDVSARA